MDEPLWRRLLPRSGVRVRTAATAALVVGLALAVAGVALVLLLDRSLRGVSRSQAGLVAQQITVPLAEGEPVAETIRGSASAVSLIQVIDPVGRVVASTAALSGQDALVADRPVPGATVVSEIGALAVDPDEAYVVLAQGVATPSGDRIVVVAESLDVAGRSVEVARNLMLVGAPLLVLIAGLATFVASGSALRPVEAIRARVAELSDRDLGQRVPVPPVRDEVGRLAETMNAMLARLQAGQAVQRQFVADASHELRSPLSTIVAGLDLVRGRDGPDSARIDAMRTDADRLARLVDDLLLLARADERGLTPRADDVDLDELLYAEQLRLRSTAAVHVIVDVEAARVPGDPAQLRRVARNLVDNAVRHCTAEITLRLRRDGTGAVLEVADDGPGIAEEDRLRVFERFVRLDAGRARSGGGAGLGLAIVAEVVHAHGGRVEAAVNPGGGALVRVWLPGERG